MIADASGSRSRSRDLSKQLRARRRSRCFRGCLAEWRPSVLLYHGWRDGERELPWTADTMVLVWSATKGLASACLLHALEGAGLDLSTRVAEFWPEFAQAGKERLTVGEVVSHRAGLSALTDKTVGLRDHDAVVRAVELQAPSGVSATNTAIHPDLRLYRRRIRSQTHRNLAG